jgi:ferredoxin-NADP reductase
VAGQHVLLGVEVDGVMRQRAFSLSNAAGHRQPIRITLKRQPGQGTTDWLYQHASAGLVVSLSQASGAFVLPSPLPARLLMIAAGSGITPLLAMLQDLALKQYQGEILLLQLSRSDVDRLFADELEGLRRQLPGLQIQQHFSASQGRFDVSSLKALAPDLSERHTLICGPSALMQAVDEEFSVLDLPSPQRERFGAPMRQAMPGEARSIHAADSEQVFTQSSEPNLLLAAEAAGLQPRFGCRAGLCRTCLCKKQRGSVRNLLTGQVSVQPDEWIQLCISVAESDLELAL